MIYDVSNVIKEARKKEKYSVKELATKAQLSTSYIYEIESGIKTPSFENLKTLSIILNIPLPLMIMKALGNSKEAKEITKFLEDYYSIEA